MTPTETSPRGTIPAPPALYFGQIGESGALIITDANREHLFTFDPRVTLPLAVTAVNLMNILLAKPEVMPWVIALSGSGGDVVNGLGYTPGGFFTKIVEAAFAGDVLHQSELAKAFPEVVAAVRVWQNIYGSPELFAAAIKGNWVLA